MKYYIAIYLLMASSLIESCSSSSSPGNSGGGYADTTKNFLVWVEDSVDLRIGDIYPTNTPSAVDIGFTTELTYNSAYIDLTGSWSCNGVPMTITNKPEYGQHASPSLVLGEMLTFYRDSRLAIKFPIQDPPSLLNIHEGDTIPISDSLRLTMVLDSAHLDTLQLYQWEADINFNTNGGDQVVWNGLDTNRAARKYKYSATVRPSDYVTPGPGVIALHSFISERYGPKNTPYYYNRVNYSSSRFIHVCWK